MWLAAMITPPDFGMFSIPDQSRLVSTTSSGLTRVTAVRGANPIRLTTHPPLHRCPHTTAHNPPYLDGRMRTSPATIIIPVKQSAIGKSRLRSAGAVTDHLVRAIALDTIAAVRAAGSRAECRDPARRGFDRPAPRPGRARRGPAGTATRGTRRRAGRRPGRG